MEISFFVWAFCIPNVLPEIQFHYKFISGVLKVRTTVQNPDCQRVPSGLPVSANKAEKQGPRTSKVSEKLLMLTLEQKFEYPWFKSYFQAINHALLMLVLLWYQVCSPILHITIIWLTGTTTTKIMCRGSLTLLFWKIRALHCQYYEIMQALVTHINNSSTGLFINYSITSMPVITTSDQPHQIRP